MEEKQKTFLDLVLDPVEVNRVLAVTEVVSRTESYMRNVGLMLAGFQARLAAALPNETDRILEVHGALVAIQDYSSWLTSLVGQLTQYGKQPQPQSSLKVVTATEQPAEGEAPTVLH